MKKMISIVMGFALLLSVFSLAYAQSDNKVGSVDSTAAVSGSGQPEDAGSENSTASDEKGSDGAGTGSDGSDEEDDSGRQGNESGQDVRSDVETQNKGEESQIMTQQETQERVSNIKDEIKQQREEMTQQMQQDKTSEKDQDRIKNQNEVKLAVHAMLQMEEMAGGIGPQVSQVAREFNNSAANAYKAEEKIQDRSSVSKFFFGGDHDAASSIEAEVAQNQDRIQEMQRLMEDCECDEEVRAMMQEQIKTLEQDQERLKSLAAEEKKSKGIIGWLWK